MSISSAPFHPRAPTILDVSQSLLTLYLVVNCRMQLTLNQRVLRSDRYE
jgi:hypothetical protein